MEKKIDKEKANLRYEGDVMKDMIFLGERKSSKRSENLDLNSFLTGVNKSPMTNYKPSGEEIELQSSINFLKKKISLLKMEIGNYDNLSKKLIDQTNSNYGTLLEYSSKNSKPVKKNLDSKKYKKLLKPESGETVKSKLDGYNVEKLLEIIDFQNSRLRKLEEKISPSEKFSLLEQSNLPLKPTFNMMVKSNPRVEKGLSRVEKTFEKIEKKILKIERKNEELGQENKKLDRLARKNEEYFKKSRNIEEKPKRKRSGFKKKLTRSVKMLKPLEGVIIED